MVKCSKCGEDMQEVFSNYFCDCDVLPEIEPEDINDLLKSGLGVWIPKE